MKRLVIRPSWQDGQKLLKHSKPIRNTIMMRLCLYQALREGEILGSYQPEHGSLKALTLNDFDFERKVILIHGKGGTIEEVFIDKKTLEMLLNYIQTHFSLKKQKTGNVKLFNLTTRHFQTIVKDTAIRAGVDHADRFSPHTLRAISITHYNTITGNLSRAQHHARHKSWKTTMLYDRPDSDTRREEESRVFDEEEQ